MKSKKRYLFLILLIIMIAVVACGQAGPPVPTVDSSARETSLAGTALSFDTATPSPTPTETSVPTAVVSSQGTSLVTGPDQATLFSDHKAGIQLTFPAGWLAFRVGESEFYAAWENEATKSPVFLNIFAAMQDSDPAQFRVTAIDIREQVTYENFSKMEVVFAPDDKRTLNEVRAVQAKKFSILKAYKLLSSIVTKIADGHEAAIIELQWESTSPENVTHTDYHKEVILKVPSGTVALQLYTPLDQKDAMLPLFDQVLGSLVFLAP